MILPLALCLLPGNELLARGAYQSAKDFIAESFAGHPPAAQVLWITSDLKPAIRAILGHDLQRLRLRYWQKNGRSAWILEEIGKERPITFGVVVAGGRIEKLRVLAFRESRGWEIRYPFFTDQFNGAALGRDLSLDRQIDNISGATLSVRAASRVARLALLLDQQLNRP